jgi:hypothetical protein
MTVVERMRLSAVVKICNRKTMGALKDHLPGRRTTPGNSNCINSFGK